MPTYFMEGGHAVHFEEENPAGHPPVVLLHGLGSAGGDWVLQFPPLSQAGFRVVAPDIPGFGWSPWPGGKVTVPRLAQLTASFMEGTGAQPAHLVGISMGGTIALQLTLDRPRLVRSLTLVNTFACLRPRGLSQWLYFALRILTVHTLGLERQADLVVKRIFPRPDQEELRAVLRGRIRQVNPKVYRATMRALTRFDVSQRLGEIRVPTLVVTGDEDTTVPPEVQAQLVAGISGARQVIIPGGGHAVIADSPQAFNRALLEFLQQLPARAGEGRDSQG